MKSEFETLLLEKQVLNTVAALALLSGKTSIYGRLLRKFLQSMDDGIYNIEDLLQLEQCDNAARVAHSLKGICLNIGAERVHALAVEMDTAFKAGDMEKVILLTPELQKEFQILKEKILLETEQY